MLQIRDARLDDIPAIEEMVEDFVKGLPAREIVRRLPGPELSRQPPDP